MPIRREFDSMNVFHGSLFVISTIEFLEELINLGAECLSLPFLERLVSNGASIGPRKQIVKRKFFVQFADLALEATNLSFSSNFPPPPKKKGRDIYYSRGVAHDRPSLILSLP